MRRCTGGGLFPTLCAIWSNAHISHPHANTHISHEHLSHAYANTHTHTHISHEHLSHANANARTRITRTRKRMLAHTHTHIARTPITRARTRTHTYHTHTYHTHTPLFADWPRARRLWEDADQRLGAVGRLSEHRRHSAGSVWGGGRHGNPFVWLSSSLLVHSLILLLSSLGGL